MSPSLQLAVSIPADLPGQTPAQFPGLPEFFFMCRHNYQRLFCLIFTKGNELYFAFFTWGSQRNSLQNEWFCAAFFQARQENYFLEFSRLTRVR